MERKRVLNFPELYNSPMETEEDGIPYPRSLHSRHPEPLRTAIQEAAESLLKESERITAKRKEKIISGSLEDIRERLMIK